MRQIARQPFRHCDAVGRGPARTDHSQHERLQKFHFSANEEQDRRIEDLAQRLRVARIANRDQLSPRLHHLFLLHRGVFKGASAGNGLRHRTADPAAFELRTRSPEDGLRRAETVEQFSGCSGAKARNQLQCQPVKLLFPGQDRCMHASGPLRFLP